MCDSDESARLWVLLEHEGGSRGTHFDLMLREGDAFFTLRLSENPLTSCGEQEAERAADHPLEFFHREGLLSGGKGRARRVARGEFEGRGVPSRGGTFRLRCARGGLPALRITPVGGGRFLVTAVSGPGGGKTG